jgi:hypothetical protein
VELHAGVPGGGARAGELKRHEQQQPGHPRHQQAQEDEDEEAPTEWGKGMAGSTAALRDARVETVTIQWVRRGVYQMATLHWEPWHGAASREFSVRKAAKLSPTEGFELRRPAPASAPTTGEGDGATVASSPPPPQPVVGVMEVARGDVLELQIVARGGRRPGASIGGGGGGGGGRQRELTPRLRERQQGWGAGQPRGQRGQWGREGQAIAGGARARWSPSPRDGGSRGGQGTMARLLSQKKAQAGARSPPQPPPRGRGGRSAATATATASPAAAEAGHRPRPRPPGAKKARRDLRRAQSEVSGGDARTQPPAAAGGGGAVVRRGSRAEALLQKKRQQTRRQQTHRRARTAAAEPSRRSGGGGGREGGAGGSTRRAGGAGALKAKASGKKKKPPKPKAPPPAATPPRHLARSPHTQSKAAATARDTAAEEQAMRAQFPQFTYFDRDGDGTIDRAEVKAMMELLGFDLSDETYVDGIMSRYDTDGDGTVDVFEFKQLWEHIDGAAALRPSFWRPILTEIYLCDVCSCQELLRRNGRGQATRSWPPSGSVSSSGRRCARASTRRGRGG